MLANFGELPIEVGCFVYVLPVSITTCDFPVFIDALAVCSDVVL